MKLITMAHMGEALATIEKWDLVRKGQHFFEGDELSLLITGEGPVEASIITASYLGRSSFTEVINIGIAGALKDDLRIGELHPVRTCYLVVDGAPQFKSVSTAGATGLDCVSSFQRILDPDRARPLRGLAQLVDREAWGIAMAAKQNGIPFQCYKLISDIAGTLGACELIRERVAEFSLLIACHLEASLGSVVSAKKEISSLDGFHFSVSMRHRLDRLLSHLALREDVPREELCRNLPLSEIRGHTRSPKDRARYLLDHLQSRLDPMKEVIDRSIESWKEPLCSQGIEVQLDPEFERQDVRFSFSASSDVELRKKLLAFGDFSLRPFQRILEGDFHVE